MHKNYFLSLGKGKQNYTKHNLLKNTWQLKYEEMHSYKNATAQ